MLKTALNTAIKRLVPYRVYTRVQSAVRYVTSRRYVGQRFRCPFCGGRYSKFFPNGIDVPILSELQIIGGGYRTNSKCPRCRSEDRERLVFLFLQKTKPFVFDGPHSLLHIAPEKSLSMKLKGFSNIRYISGDLDSPVADVRLDITDMKLKSESFDVIICNHVLEHVPDDGKAMRELLRVTKRGGFAILQVPLSPMLEKTREDFSVIDPSERERQFGQSDHVRIYGKDYTERLEAAGWIVSMHGPHEFLDAESFLEYGLLEDERIFLCSKP